MLDDIGNQQEHLLVKRASYDSAAFQVLYEVYFKRVYSYVAAKTSNRFDAEDLVSDIFLQVLKGLPQFKNRHHFSFAAWIFTIARHTVTDFYRRQGRIVDGLQLEVLKHNVVDLADLDDRLIDQERGAELRTLLNRLPERRREVIILKYFTGLRNQEIAQVLDLDERTVASYLSRGLKDLYETYTAKLKTEQRTLHDEPG